MVELFCGKDWLLLLEGGKMFQLYLLADEIYFVVDFSR